MAALGVGGRAQYPRVAEDPLAAFHDLAHDLKELTISDFLEGSGEILRREAARVSADAPRGQREYMAQAAGDVSKREHARERFRAGDYATVRALLEGFQYPDLATEVERRMLEVARARTT